MAHTVPTVIFLESFVESTFSVAPEMQRILTTVKVLDERSVELSESLQHDIDALVALPPHHTNAHDPARVAEYNDLAARVQQQQAMLLQFASEKVNLAQQAHDLVEMHAVELERTLDQFETELKNSGMMDAYEQGADGFGGYEAAPPPPPSTTGGGSKRDRELSIKPEAQPWDMGQPAAEMPPPAPAYTKKATQAPPKRPRDEDGDGFGGGGGGNQRRMKSSRASAAALAADADGGGGGYTPRGAPTPSEEPSEISFMNPPPHGLKPSAPSPQLGSRLLMYSDINEALIGRHAEMYWPDDLMWYVVEIQSLDMRTKLARVVYWTGEMEDLVLDDIAKAGHMMLIDSDPVRSSRR